MNRLHYLFVFFLIGYLFISCNKSNIEYEGNYNKSYKSWVSFKELSNNSYSYTINTSSWTGFSTGTVITVKAGKVTGRSFVAKRIANDGSNSIVTMEEWNEEEGQLNTHQNGAPALTLDEIYQKAKTDWLLKRDNTKVYFETNNNGMISSCGYTENGCADDCFTGITIGYIKAA